MSAEEKARSEWSTARFLRMKNSPEAKRVTEKYGDLVHREAGSMWFMAFTFACMSRASGRTSRAQFNAAVTLASKQSGIPLQDMKMMARLNLAMTESMLIGSDQLPLVTRGGRDEC